MYTLTSFQCRLTTGSLPQRVADMLSEGQFNPNNRRKFSNMRANPERKYRIQIDLLVLS